MIASSITATQRGAAGRYAFGPPLGSAAISARRLQSW